MQKTATRKLSQVQNSNIFIQQNASKLTRGGHYGGKEGLRQKRDEIC